jgi:hypothetical protein
MPPLLFVSPEGEILTEKTPPTQSDEVGTLETTSMEELRHIAAREAAKVSTHKKVIK